MRPTSCSQTAKPTRLGQDIPQHTAGSSADSHSLPARQSLYLFLYLFHGSIAQASPELEVLPSHVLVFQAHVTVLDHFKHLLEEKCQVSEQAESPRFPSQHPSFAPLFFPQGLLLEFAASVRNIQYLLGTECN